MKLSFVNARPRLPFFASSQIADPSGTRKCSRWSFQVCTTNKSPPKSEVTEKQQRRSIAASSQRMGTDSVPWLVGMA